MSESLPDEQFPTLDCAGDDRPTPPPESFDCLPTLGGAAPAAPTGERVPTIPGYEIIEEIGRGGMGVVYRARQINLGRFVALKVLRAGPHSPTALARFEREAGVTARLAHPGVVQVHDVGRYDVGGGETRPYIAFELVNGTSLDQVLRGGVLPPRDAAAVLMPLARSMRVVHDAGVVHRDLKPANILLADTNRWRESPELGTPTAEYRPPAAGSTGTSSLNAGSPGFPRITDFGLAHLLAGDDGLTRDGQVLGTPSYMAPEQIGPGHGSVGPRSDIHALGAILYECLTGRPPFKGASVAETLSQVIQLEPVPPRGLRPNVPRDLETICLKCLHKDPARRYATGDDLADDLERFLNSRPITARPVSRLERLWRGCRRRPGTAALVVVATLAVAALLALAGWVPARIESIKKANESESERARVLAASNRYHTLAQQLAHGSERLEPGWPTRGLATIREASALDTPLRDPVALRGLGAECLAAIDFEETKLPIGFTTSRMAFHPRKAVLAVAQAKAWPITRCQVVLLEVPSGKVMHTLGFLPGVRWKGNRVAQDGVSALAFSPDGRWLVAGSRVGWLYRWDLEKPEAAPTSWSAHKDSVHHVCLDGSAVFSTGADGALKRWPLTDGTKKPSHEFANGGQAVAIGGELHVAGGDRIHFLRPADLTPLRAAEPGDACLIAATSRTGAVTSRQSLSLYDPVAKRRRIHIRRKGMKAHDSAIEDVAISPDGSLIASSAENDGTVRVWDAASAEAVAEWSLLDTPCRVSFDSSGNWLAVLVAREVRLFAVRRSAVQSLAALQCRPIHSICWTGRGELAAVVGDRSDCNGEIGVWPADGGPARVRRALTFPEPRLTLGVKALDGQMAWIHDKGVSLAPANDLVENGRVAGKELNALSLAGGSQWLASGLKLQRHDGVKPGPAWHNTASDVLSGKGTLTCVSAGRRRVVVGAKDGAVRVLNVDCSLERTMHLGSAPICAVALSADELRALVGLSDGAVKLVNLDAGRTLASERHRGRVESVAYLPDGRMVTGSADGSMRFWGSGDELRPWLTVELGSPVMHLSAEGDRLAAVLGGERAVRVWHLDRLRERLAEMGLDEPGVE